MSSDRSGWFSGAERTGAAVAVLLGVRDAAGAGFATPELLDVDADAGVMVSGRLTGAPLHELLTTDAARPAARAAGRAIAALHAAEPPPGACGRHAAAEEAAVLQAWLQHLAAYAPVLGRTTAAAANDTLRALADSPATETVLLHRDLHDKQIFVDPDGRVGLLDFDTLATGPAAIDVANLLAHLELRGLQGVVPAQRARAVAAELLTGYASFRDVPDGLEIWIDAVRLRLACVYAFRPRWSPVVPALLGLVGSPAIPCSETRIARRLRSASD